MPDRIKAAMMVLAGALVGAFLVTPTPLAPPKAYRITFNLGGPVVEFIELYERVRRSGRAVIIDGICASACTLVIGLVPNDRICVTPFAKLAFHSASLGPHFSGEGTRLIWRIYPENFRVWLRAKGFDGDTVTADHPNLLYLEGDALTELLRAC